MLAWNTRHGTFEPFKNVVPVVQAALKHAPAGQLIREERHTRQEATDGTAALLPVCVPVCQPGYLAARLPGCLSVWLCGWLSVWLCGCRAAAVLLRCATLYLVLCLFDVLHLDRIPQNCHCSSHETAAGTDVQKCMS